MAHFQIRKMLGLQGAGNSDSPRPVAACLEERQQVSEIEIQCLLFAL